VTNATATITYGRANLTEPAIRDIFARLTRTKTARVIERYGFGEFLAIVKEVRERVSDDIWLEVGWEILEGMGLEEFYGCDYDIFSALEYIPPQSDLVDIQTFLQHSLVEVLLEQFENEGTTALLDISKMVETPAAALIPKIIELRKSEIEKIIVPITGKEIVLYNVYMQEIGRTTEPENSVFLMPLWLTAYGYQTLSALGMSLRTTLEGLVRIQQTLAKIGISLRAARQDTENENQHSRMSNAMRLILLRKAEGQTHKKIVKL
jgi:hypothetical protein